jgi:NAD(P)-dependent dehydrogenase (short-subunit alcohol dehydrogenase family)
VSSLAGRRVLVVGASRGIGLAIAAACAGEGAAVALAARSADKLEAAARECGPTALAIKCDVRDEANCASAVAEAVEQLGGLDVLVYSTAMSISRLVENMRLKDWQCVFETNVFGACAVTSAALPDLLASNGHAIYLNSESALYQPTPWRGIGAYIASKRALDSMVRSFQMENPTVAFTNYVVGATVTEFGSDSEAENVMEFAPDWYNRGYVGADLLEPGDHGQFIIDILNLPRRLRVDHVGARVRASS